MNRDFMLSCMFATMLTLASTTTTTGHAEWLLYDEPVVEATRPPVSPEEASRRRAFVEGLLEASPPDNEAIRAHLREEIGSLDKADPLCGWMTLKLAYMDYRVGEYPKARENFRAVALGEVGSTPDIRAEAMLRYARLANSADDRARALRVWREIDQQSSDLLQRAEARRHLAALLLEQASGNNATAGSMESLRLFVDDSLTLLPASDERLLEARAAIATAAVESFAKEKQWSQFPVAHDHWLAEHAANATADDWASLMYSRGLAMAELKRSQEAEAAMLAAAGLDSMGAPTGRITLWIRQQALKWLSEEAARRKEPEEARAWTAIHWFVSSSEGVERLARRAEAGERPKEAAMWRAIQEATHVRSEP